MSEAEGQYCDCRARDFSERLARLRWARVRRLAVLFGLWGAALVLALLSGALVFLMVDNPFAAIGAIMVMAASLRSILQMVGQVAASGRG